MKIVKNYLKAEELVNIVSTLEEHESFVEKEIIKIGMVAQYCVDELIENKDNLDCGEIYDLLLENNLYKDILSIENYDVIDKLLNKYEDISTMIQVFLNKVLDSMKDVNAEETLNNLISQLKEMSDK